MQRPHGRAVRRFLQISRVYVYKKNLCALVASCRAFDRKNVRYMHACTDSNGTITCTTKKNSALFSCYDHDVTYPRALTLSTFRWLAFKT